MKIEDNKKSILVDGNELVADFNNDKYYITFTNYEGEKVTSEIPKEIFDTYIASKRIYYRNENEQRRHWEESSIFDETLYKRANKYQQSIEATVIENEKKRNIHIAISKIPHIQKERIKLKYFDELKEKELAEKEGISIRAVQYSLHCAIENLKKFKKFLD